MSQKLQLQINDRQECTFERKLNHSLWKILIVRHLRDIYVCLCNCVCVCFWNYPIHWLVVLGSLIDKPSQAPHIYIYKLHETAQLPLNSVRLTEHQSQWLFHLHYFRCRWHERAETLPSRSLEFCPKVGTQIFLKAMYRTEALGDWEDPDSKWFPTTVEFVDWYYHAKA